MKSKIKDKNHSTLTSSFESKPAFLKVTILRGNREVLSLSTLILAKDPTCVGPQYLSNILMQDEFHISDDKSMLCKVGTVHPNMKWVIMEMVRM